MYVCMHQNLNGMDLVVQFAGVGAGETAIESLLSTNPDPDHVTHAHAGEAPSPRAGADNSPTPSIDSDKENNVEMVNLLHHPNTPGGVGTPTPGGSKQQRNDTFVDIADGEDQQQLEQPVLKEDHKSSVKVCRMHIFGPSRLRRSVHRQSKTAEAMASLYYDTPVEGVFVRICTGGCRTKRAKVKCYVACEDISVPISAALLCLLCTSRLYWTVWSYATAATQWHSVYTSMLLCAMRRVLIVESSKLLGSLLNARYLCRADTKHQHR